MLGQLHARLPYHFGAEGQRVHEDVFGQSEMPEVVPCEALPGFHRPTEVHHVLVAFAYFVVHVIGDEHVDRFLGCGFPAKHGHHLFQRFGADPVVGVHDFDVHAGRGRHTGVDRAAVPLVFLMDGTDDSRVAIFVFLRHFQGSVG